MANVGIYDMTDTWNNAGTSFTAIKMNVTDTASASGSKLLDIQKGGSSYLELNKSGELGILDKIFHLGDTNTAIRFPAADTVTVETAGTERLRIDSSGRVGIGTTPAAWDSPLKVLQVNTGSLSTYTNLATIVSANAYLDSVGWKYIESSVNRTAEQYELGQGAHRFAVAPSGAAGAAISFATKVRIDSDGLKFNSDTAAANALDDYEEGTWTPSLINSGSPSYAVQSGTYVKVGRMVRCTFYLSYTGATIGASSRIAGLPFATTNDLTLRLGFAVDFITGNVKNLGTTGLSTTAVGTDLLATDANINGEVILLV